VRPTAIARPAAAVSAGLLLVLLVALAQAVAGRSGALRQLPGRAGCVAGGGGKAGCARVRGLSGADGVTVSPDGRNVYASSENSDSLAVFSRTRSGALRQLRGARGCFSQRGKEGCARGRALAGAYAVAIPADGRHAYAPSDQSDALAVFARNRRTGALRQLDGARGCLSIGGREGCAPARGLDGAFGATVSPDGRVVYAASEYSDAVTVFSRDRTTGAVTQPAGAQGCVSLHGKGGCAFGRGLDGVTGVAVSRDGRTAYSAAGDGAAVAVLSRDRRSGALTQLPGKRGCVSLRGKEGCSRGRALGGALALAVSPDDRNVYVAASTANAVAVLVRNRRTGALHQPRGARGCVSLRGKGSCRRARALSVPMAVRVSPDGRNVYAAAYNSGLVTFARQRGTGALRQLPGVQGCIGLRRLVGCTPGRGLADAVDIAFGRGGSIAYGASEAAGLAVFRR
jgi:DNA-binding beta-propeller fold protein YncE